MSVVDEVPTLTWGREQTAAWTQAVMTVAALVRDRRLAQGRGAWSRAEDAARRHDRVARAADPAVRLMDAAEHAAWRQFVASPETTVATRSTSRPDGEVTVASGLIGDRWAMMVRTVTPDGVAHELAVSCRDELTARRLGDEVLREGRDGAARLAAFATMATERARAAQAGVLETDEQLHHRTAAAVYEVLHPDLAEEIAASKAFGALSWRLAQMEAHGYRMSEVLAFLDQSILSKDSVKNPAALAEWAVENMVDEVEEARAQGRAARPEKAGALRREGQTDRYGRRTTDLDGPATAAASTGDAAVGGVFAHDPVLREQLGQALGPELTDVVATSPGHDAVHAALRWGREQGRDVDVLLADLPATAIGAAHDPGAYLASVLRRRVEHEPPPPVLHRSGVNRVGMADLVSSALPAADAGAVTDCAAWPWLAGKLAGWSRDGVPVADLLATLPAQAVAGARKPAAYAAVLMDSRVRQHRQPDAGREVGISVERDAAPGQNGRPAGDSIAAAARHEPVEADLDGDLDVHLDAHVDAQLDWAETLDPTQEIDRIGIEATLGLGSPDRDERLHARLVDATSTQTRGSGPQAGGSAAGVGDARAAEHEHDATHARAERDDQQTTVREDLTAEGQARRDEHLAAAERATAVAERGDAVAAAVRAEVTLTRSAAAGRPQLAARARRGQIPRPPTVQPTPEPHQGRHR